MRVVYHPDFPKDIKRFEKQYRDISERLALRFRAEVDGARMNAIGWHPAGMQNVFVWLTGGVALLNHRLMAANPVGFSCPD